MENVSGTERMASVIRRCREQEHWTQKELADRLDVTEKAVSSWENNTSTPRIGKLQKMSELFHVPISYLLSGNIDIMADIKLKQAAKEELRRERANLLFDAEKINIATDSKPPLDIIIENVNLINVEQLKRVKAYIDALLALRAENDKDVM